MAKVIAVPEVFVPPRIQVVFAWREKPMARQQPSRRPRESEKPELRRRRGNAGAKDFNTLGQTGLVGTSCGKVGRLDSRGERAALVIGFLKSLAQFTVGDKVAWPQRHGLLQCLDRSIMLPTTSLDAAQSQPNIGLTGPPLRCLSGGFGSFLKSPLSFQYDY